MRQRDQIRPLPAAGGTAAEGPQPTQADLHNLAHTLDGKCGLVLFPSRACKHVAACPRTDLAFGRHRHTLTAPPQHTINERLKSAKALAVQTLTETRTLLEEVTEALMAECELDCRQIRMLTAATNGTLPPS